MFFCKCKFEILKIIINENNYKLWFKVMDICIIVCGLCYNLIIIFLLKIRIINGFERRILMYL